MAKILRASDVREDAWAVRAGSSTRRLSQDQSVIFGSGQMQSVPWCPRCV
ncbi:MAG: hypothetical protein ACRECH_11220 [Nitrososphaerales archaeon]